MGESEFRFFHEVPVRFQDLDPMGHAHHALPLVLFEEARARYWREVAGRESVSEIDYIMKDVHVTYHARMRFPGTVRVGVRVAELGNSSFTMEYEVRDDRAALLATGRTVQVMFDYVTGETRPIDGATRGWIEEYEAGSVGRGGDGEEDTASE